MQTFSVLETHLFSSGRSAREVTHNGPLCSTSVPRKPQTCAIHSPSLWSPLAFFLKHHFQFICRNLAPGHSFKGNYILPPPPNWVFQRSLITSLPYSKIFSDRLSFSFPCRLMFQKALHNLVSINSCNLAFCSLLPRFSLPDVAGRNSCPGA